MALSRRITLIGLPLAMASGGAAVAHEFGGPEAAFVARAQGPAPGPFAYLGAKHMVTGYDHLLFLLGVVFFLRRFREVLLFVSLFALGHSITLLLGALAGFGLNAHLVDAVIGLSIAYKAFDNLGGFEATLRWRPDPRLMVFGFGLIHGIGLATRIEALRLHREGLIVNLVSFNIGVEIGQLIGLSLILAILLLWRRSAMFAASAVAANWLIMTAGFLLTAWQLTGYLWSGR